MQNLVKVPPIGEGRLVSWLRKDGEHVAAGDALCTIETDKVSTELTADIAGVLRIQKIAGARVQEGEVVGEIGETLSSHNGKERSPNSEEPLLPIRMPKVADTMTSGTIQRWLVNLGDRVVAGQDLAIVDAGLLILPLESCENGTVASILVPAGHSAPCGEVIANLRPEPREGGRRKTAESATKSKLESEPHSPAGIAKRPDHTSASKQQNATSPKPEKPAAIPTLSHSVAAQLLASCGTLSDPVLALSRYLFGVCVIVLPLLLFQYRAPVVGLWQEGSTGPALVLTFIYLLAAAALPLAMWLTFRPSDRPRAFYLRAFRSDADATHLRRLIRFALGDCLRLTGIRPPRERVSWLSRTALATSTGFRYLGTDHFELEAADRNWIARLCASYRQARLLFVDLRDITTHVQDEIRLSCLALGLERCVFIIDRTGAENDMRKELEAILGIPRDEAARALFLIYPGTSATAEELKQFCYTVRSAFHRAPATQPDLRRALSFARERVLPSHWGTSFLEKDAAPYVISTLILGTLGYGLSLVWPAGTAWLFGLLATAGVFFFIRALSRSRREFREFERIAREVGEAKPDGSGRLRAATAFLVIWLLLLAVAIISIPPLKAARNKAALASERSHLRALWLRVKFLINDQMISGEEIDVWQEALRQEVKEAKPRRVAVESGEERLLQPAEWVGRDASGSPYYFIQFSSDAFVIAARGQDHVLGTADDVYIDADGSVHFGPTPVP